MLCWPMLEGRKPVWLAIGAAGILAGLLLYFLAHDPALSHLGLVLAIAMPVIAFYRLMRPAIGKRHCPRPPEWTAP